MDPKFADQRRRSGQYCQYHEDYGHDTDSCVQLKRHVDGLIQSGDLQQYLHPDPETKRIEDRPPVREHRDDRTRTDANPRAGGVIHTITGGILSRSNSVRSVKAHARTILKVDGQPPPKQRRSSWEITFSEDDQGNLLYPHSDPIVISPKIDNIEVRRTLIDTGSSAEILFYHTFLKMGYHNSVLRPFSGPLKGLADIDVAVEGVIDLSIELGEEAKSIKTVITFIVVNVASSYNVILGRPFLNLIRASIHPLYLLLKFPTEGGIATIRGDQVTARQCYHAELNSKTESMKISLGSPSKAADSQDDVVDN